MNRDTEIVISKEALLTFSIDSIEYTLFVLAGLLGLQLIFLGSISSNFNILLLKWPRLAKLIPPEYLIIFPLWGSTVYKEELVI